MNEAIPVSLKTEHYHLKNDPLLSEAIPASLETKHNHFENDHSLADIVQETIHFVGSLKGKKFVVKLGGSTLEHQRAVLQDIIWLHALGANITLAFTDAPRLKRMGVLPSSRGLATVYFWSNSRGPQKGRPIHPPRYSTGAFLAGCCNA